MPAVLASLWSGIDWTSPADVILTRLVTIGGRVPFQDALSALPIRDQGIVLRTIGDDTLKLRPMKAQPTTGDLVVSQSPQGRLALRSVAPTGTHAIGLLQLPESALEQIDEAADAWQICEEAERAHIDSLVTRWDQDGVLAERVREVAEWVDRVETVLIYINDEIFSRSDAGTSTLLRDGGLARLTDTPLRHWSPAERLFVAAAHILFAAGQAVRFEEFNGRQLSATGLKNWLLTTWRRYAHCADLPLPSDLAARPPDRLAADLPELASAVDRSSWVRFRRIAAPLFTKRETATFFAAGRVMPELPPAVRAFAEGRLDWEYEFGQSAEEALGTIVSSIISEHRSDATALIEELLATIVHSAALDLRADYAMSSAVRDPRELAPEASSPAGAVLRLRKPDFFCCVMPHPNLRDARLSESLWLVAQRMQYNRWHFVPGNFDRASIPAERHYLFPPALPDLAEFSDLWHGGHIAARVRSTVRAPGAQSWRTPLDVAGNSYRGCFDIRAVRRSGRAFGLRELRTAIQYCGLVDELWRTVVHRLGHAGTAVVVTGFDREWYARREWERMPGYASLTSGP